MDFLAQIVSSIIIFFLLLGVLMFVIMYGGYIVLGLVAVGLYFTPALIEKVIFHYRE